MPKHIVAKVRVVRSRATAAMGSLLALHLGVMFAPFLTILSRIWLSALCLFVFDSDRIADISDRLIRAKMRINRFITNCDRRRSKWQK